MSHVAHGLSQAIPSPSRSKSCGSGGNTVNPSCGTSGQFKSGGGDAIHTVG
jgi:hypothetical protein